MRSLVQKPSLFSDQRAKSLKRTMLAISCISRAEMPLQYDAPMIEPTLVPAM